MNNAIKEVQRQYTFAVQPVQFFETRNNQALQKNSFDFIDKMKESGNNPFHPNIENSGKGGKLDLLS